MKLPPCGTPRIVIVGGGVAGLLLATRLGPRLARMRGRVTLVDRSWTHVWKPMLHTFAAGTWNVHQQQVQTLLHARTHRFEYVPGQLDATTGQPIACVSRQCTVQAKRSRTRILGAFPDAVSTSAAAQPESADRPLPPTAQVANQQALHLIRHLPAERISALVQPKIRMT
jgi:NADH dehydrogenase FAD-containing subunit